MSEVATFKIDVPDSELDDLQQRLINTRWPDPEPVDDWSQGISQAYMQEVCAYWADEYDWRARERALNRFDQFTIGIQGIDIHFIHMRSPHQSAEPLILSHGWPSSVVEFHRVIEPLLDPPSHGGDAADAFHVVVPSLPGYGFSGKPKETGWGVDRIAEVFAELMARLGYHRYFAQGGDWGSVITGAMGALDPEHCAGIHVTMPLSSGRVEGDPTPEEERALTATDHYWKWESGYSYQQATKPQTIGYSLVDSPVGLAAWILEKYQTWTDNHGHVEDVLTRDELLDNIMFYWLNRAGASSARLYWESFFRGPRHTVTVPSGFAVFPKEIVPAVRKWVERRYTNIHHWSEFAQGGHFPALEVPDVYLTDVRDCFRALR